MRGPKIVSAAGLSRALTRLRKARKRIVFTNGCFDILHAGHVDYLQRARRLGDTLIVGLNSDRSVRSLKKGPGRPVNHEADRARVLAALACVDVVTVFDESTPARLIERIAPDVLVKGADWDVRAIVGSDVVRARGGKVVTVPYLTGYSTTRLLKKIASAGGRSR